MGISQSFDPPSLHQKEWSLFRVPEAHGHRGVSENHLYLVNKGHPIYLRDITLLKTRLGHACFENLPHILAATASSLTGTFLIPVACLQKQTCDLLLRV